MSEHADIASLPFEKALAELEQIVTRLESGKVDLEQSITIYERGEALKKRLRTGTVLTYDDRNWELHWAHERPLINLSRAVGPALAGLLVAGLLWQMF